MIPQVDQRRITRIYCHISVDYVVGKGSTLNASPNGLLIRGDFLPHVGAIVPLRMTFTVDGLLVYGARAVVKWTKATTFGVELITVTHEAKTRLIELLIFTYEPSSDNTRTAIINEKDETNAVPIQGSVCNR